VIIADTSGLLAFFDRSESAHQAARDAIDTLAEPLVVSPYVVAELDYLLGTRVGVDAELTVLGELAKGAYILAEFGPADVERATHVIRRYRDQSVGIADASIVVLADRYGTRRILTLDHRHFDVLRPLSGGRFSVLP
jgi:predicted nucleic acid-binding protein